MTFFKLASAAGVALALSSVSAMAQTATQNIQLNAVVTDFCSIAGTASGALQNRTITVTNGNVATAALAQVSVNSVACTKISNLTLTTTNTGLTTAGSNGSFQNVIHYSAAASFAGAAPTLNTSSATSATAATNTGANGGTLTVDITPIANTLPMLAGNYADVLVVTLTPQ
jgi:hypothetical protein